MRDIHPSSGLAFSSPQAGPSRQRPPPTTQVQYDEPPDTDGAAFPLKLDVGLKSSTDKILQWPIFDELLAPLQRHRFVDFHGSETYTYLDDILNLKQSGVVGSRLAAASWDSSAPISISTERADVEPLVDQFFKRVNIKNPILSRRVASQYCQQYYENGPFFNLETCLLFLICALGAISMDFEPPNVGQSPGSSTHPATRLASLRLAHCYFVAAESDSVLPCQTSALLRFSAYALRGELMRMLL